MKRLVISRSAIQMYSQKWQNSEASSDSGSNNELLPTPFHLESQVSTIEAVPVGNGNGNGTGRGWNEECMYRAALQGDWLAAQLILGRDPKLARDYITENGDRALHVAAAMKHEKFVRGLVEHMTAGDLALLDGRGYTPCCYAAISGVVEIVRVMIEKSPILITARDVNNVTPLQKAALRGNEKMVSYFLESTGIEDFSEEEWFDLLLVTIRRKMFDVAIKIVEINGSVATMANEEGTALHLLARQHVSNVTTWGKSFLLQALTRDAYWYEPPSFNKLGKKLWYEMQRMEKASVLELIKKHHILHDAVKAEHGELVTMLTSTYPQLTWEIDGNGYTIFHMAVRYRQYDMLHLIPQVGVMIDLSAISQDQDGNNILHLAAKLPPCDRVRLPQSTILFQRDLSWFKCIERIVPPSCLEMRNNEGLMPRELFSKEHKSLLEYSQMWMRNTAESFMLIATILLTASFAIAYSVPGGYEGSTGKPVLLEREHFDTFLLMEVIAHLGSVISIVLFRSIMASSFVEDEFLLKLPLQLRLGFFALYLSLSSTVMAFEASISLENPKLEIITWLITVTIVFVGPFWVWTETMTMLNWKSPLRKSWLMKPKSLFSTPINS